MKYLCVVILFLSSSAFALGPRNICTDEPSITKFDLAHQIKISKLTAESNSLKIQVPIVFSKYTLVVIYMVYSNNTGELLRVPLATESSGDNVVSHITYKKETLDNLQLWASYNDHPGSVVFDGSYCEFKLKI